MLWCELGNARASILFGSTATQIVNKRLLSFNRFYFLLDAQYICSLCTFFLQSYSSARFDVLFDLNILNNVNDFMIGVFYRGGRSCDLGNLDLSFDSAKAAGKRNYLVKLIDLLISWRLLNICRRCIFFWITDDGSLLPYFPTSVQDAQHALNTALVLHAYRGFRLEAVHDDV